MTTEEFKRKFNYDGGSPSTATIAREAQKVTNNLVLVNKATEFLEKKKEFEEKKKEFELELLKIDFPQWD